YSYPSCATFNVLLALLNGVARLARRTLNGCGRAGFLTELGDNGVSRVAVRCRAELIAPIWPPNRHYRSYPKTLCMAMSDCLLPISFARRSSVIGAEHGCKRGTLPFLAGAMTCS
ncbi:hypothetical protein L210DRAFT_3558057, partial [Boletus edulis BED1]